MVQEDALDGITMGKYINYLLDKIKELEAPIDNDETEKIRIKVGEMFEDCQTGEILAYLLEQVYNKLDKITLRSKEFAEFAEKVKTL